LACLIVVATTHRLVLDASTPQNTTSKSPFVAA
jgi:hypothetical protein